MPSFLIKGQRSATATINRPRTTRKCDIFSLTQESELKSPQFRYLISIFFICFSDLGIVIDNTPLKKSAEILSLSAFSGSCTDR